MKLPNLLHWLPLSALLIITSPVTPSAQAIVLVDLDSFLVETGLTASAERLADSLFHRYETELLLEVDSLYSAIQRHQQACSSIEAERQAGKRLADWQQSIKNREAQLTRIKPLIKERYANTLKRKIAASAKDYTRGPLMVLDAQTTFYYAEARSATGWFIERINTSAQARREMEILKDNLCAEVAAWFQ